MLFNSIDFAIFLPIVFFIYWFVLDKNRKLQNILLVIASYIFYGWWDHRFLSLIIFSSLVDYFIGLELSGTSNERKRKLLLFTSIFVNLGFLGFFKYYNFFLENFLLSFRFFGYTINGQGLNIILPVGISFYTFQTLSYSIDVYKYKMKPTRDIVSFLAFVSFFPQLVAGPIERAVNLLPQFYKRRIFVYEEAVDGMRQILWGLFKKIVIADNCAVYANDVFKYYSEYSASKLFFGVFFFAFQIYGDFSGYSDIAIGTARLFGFSLTKNFAFPYFSRDIAEFWRRWHISLSTWFRDYVYIPLGGSRGKLSENIRNIFIIFILSGFWHGAHWKFIVWGALNAIYFMPLLLMNKNRKNIDTAAKEKIFPSVTEMLQMVITFSAIFISWIFFRSESLYDAFLYIRRMFHASLFSFPEFVSRFEYPVIGFKNLLLIICFFSMVEWIQREKEHGLEFKKKLLSLNVLRWGIYVFLIFTIFYLSNLNNYAFVYFQF